ncbi:MAG: hypothetical protein V4635_01540 [Bacteroidota bacterium]
MVNLGLILEYEVIFPAEPAKSLKEYFKGASRDRVLKLGVFLLGFKNQNSAFNDNVHVLKTIFGAENNKFANDIYKLIKNQEEKVQRHVQIIHLYSSLKLFEFFFKNCTDDNEPEQTAAEFEVNFFKAYLCVNTQFTKDQNVAFKSVKHLDENLKIPMMLFCGSYPYSDKTNYDLSQQWVTQTVKANLLFKFLESNDQTKDLLAEFLHCYKCADWKDYMKKYILLTLSILKKERETYTDYVIKQGETFNEQCDFLEYFIIYEGELPADELDFLTLRSKPMYKIKRGEYRIIYDLFIVEKIYKGLYFALRDQNSRLPKSRQIKEFKSFYGKYFSEATLTYKAMEIIYPNKCMRLSGDEMDKLIDGAPDYYIRRGTDVLLFESKDFLVPVKEKDSYDYAVYDKVFEERLYFTEKDSKQHNKAVAQLINTIENILKSNFSPDTKIKPKEVTIYPIVVVHDHQYDAPGLNELINSWFIEELDVLSNAGLYTKRVKPLIIVNIDQLLYFQVALSETISLHHVIDKYFQHIQRKPRRNFMTDQEWEAHLLEKTEPFSIFLSNFMVKRKLRKLPPLLEELGLQLFDKTVNSR